MTWLMLIPKFLGSHIQTIAIIAIIGALVGFGFYFKGLQASNKALKLEVENKAEQIEVLKGSIERVRESVVQQTLALEQLNIKTTTIDLESKEAVKIFAKHNLQNLSAKKPGLIEKRVNKASQEVFLAIQQDTITFYNEGVTNP